MVQNGSIWLNIVQYGSIWFKMLQYGPDWSTVGATEVGVAAVRNNLKFLMIINIGSTIIL